MGSREKATGGIEILLMNVIVDKLDMLANYTVIDDATAFSVITEDEETGFYSDLIKRKVDIMIGGLYNNKVSMNTKVRPIENILNEFSDIKKIVEHDNTVRF